IDVHHPSPLRQRSCLHSADKNDAGVVDESVEPPMTPLDLMGSGGPGRLVCHVEHKVQIAAARQVRTLRAAAFTLDRGADRLPDRAQRAGDKHDAILQRSIHVRRGRLQLPMSSVSPLRKFRRSCLRNSIFAMAARWTSSGPSAKRKVRWFAYI